jgi:uncharacterized protein YtpQ (UPF0354 family)
MKLLPFGRKKTNPPASGAEPTAMERLLSRECSKEAFCLLFSKLLQERMPECSVGFSGETTLRVVRLDGKESTAYLDNLWLRYAKGSEDRKELIEKYIGMVSGMTRPSFSVSRENIVAMIKDTEYMAFLKPSTKSVTDHLCGDIYVVYALDSPDLTRTLTADEMEDAKVLRHELRSLAVANLKKILPAVERHGDGPWYLLTAGADYVASLLLFDEIWEELKDSVDGDIVATVPARDVLMYTGSQSENGLAEIRKRSEEISSTGPHAISSSLIVRKSDHWELFQTQ